MPEASKERPKPSAPPSEARAKRGGALRRYLSTPHDPVMSVALTVPVFLVYHLGILAIDLRNGADLVTRVALLLVEQSMALYVVVTLGVAAALVLTALFLKRQREKHETQSAGPQTIGAVGLEGLVWAIVMTFTVGWATQKVAGAMLSDATLALPLQIGERTLGPLEKVVMAAGAGFHEELVFRVLLFGLPLFLMTRFQKARAQTPEEKALAGPSLGTVIGIAIVSALLFSTVHYIGSMADSFSIGSFVFRAFAGLFLTVIYRTRGFAVAVYTHAIYDLLVFFVFSIF